MDQQSLIVDVTLINHHELILLVIFLLSSYLQQEDLIILVVMRGNTTSCRLKADGDLMFRRATVDVISRRIGNCRQTEVR